jgi:MFS family permease
VRTLTLTMLPVGFCFGAVEISLPAFSAEHGAPEWAGALLSVWAAASAIGGLAYGARTFRAPLPSVYLRLAALLPLGFLPALAAPSIAVMALLILPAGFLIAPLGAAGNQLVGEVAPRGAATEAYAWPVTAMLAGFAGGTAVGGSLVEALDWHACFVAAALAAGMGAAVAAAFRRTLGVRAAV